MKNLQTMNQEVAVENKKGEETMKKNSKITVRNLMSKKGFENLVLALVLLAVSAGIAFNVLPGTMQKIFGINTNTNNQLEQLTNIKNDGK